MTRSDARRRSVTRPGLKRALAQVAAVSRSAVAGHVRVTYPSNVRVVSNAGTPNSTQVAGAVQRTSIRQVGGDSNGEANHGEESR
jgi:hypothetical protein